MNRKENGITNLRFTLRPASSDETGLFYSMSDNEIAKLAPWDENVQKLCKNKME